MQWFRLQGFAAGCIFYGYYFKRFLLGYAIMQIPGGWLADKFGAKRVLLMAVIMWSILRA